MSDYGNQLSRVVQKRRANRNRFDLLGSVHNDIQQYHEKNSTKEALLNSENDKLKRNEFDFFSSFHTSKNVFCVTKLQEQISLKIPRKI